MFDFCTEIDEALQAECNQEIIAFDVNEILCHVVRLIFTLTVSFMIFKRR